jgi:Flp pilus assembly protein TadG
MRHGRRLSREDGAAVVEFGLITVPLLTLITFLVVCGMLLTAQIAMTNAAREGVRVWALEGQDPTIRTRESSGMSGVTVQYGLINGTVEQPGGICDPVVHAAANPPRQAYVRASRPMTSFGLPAFGMNPTVVGRAVMRCGG